MEGIGAAIDALGAVLATGEQALAILVILAAGGIVWLQYREKARLEERLLKLIEQSMQEKERSIETLRTLAQRHEQALDLLRQTLERRRVAP